MDADRNNRRASLIYKKHLGEGLTQDESNELDSLQAESEAEIMPEAERILAYVRSITDGR